MWSNVLQQFKNMTRNMNSNLLGQSKMGREEPATETMEETVVESVQEQADRETRKLIVKRSAIEPKKIVRLPLPRPSIYKPQQRDAARKVLDHFSKNNRYVILAAYTQSGKTGTFHMTISEMFKSGAIEQVLLITGSNEKELSIQYEADMKKYNGEHYRNGKIHILMRQNLEKDMVKYVPHNSDTKTLIVWDESHLVQTEKQTVDKTFKMCGIPANGDSATLELRNLYILSVSASGFSETSDIVHRQDASNTKQVVFIQPGNSYRGIEYYYRNGLIHKIFPFNSKPRLNYVMSNYGLNKYNIIRVRGKQSSTIIVNYCAEKGYDVKYFNSEKKDISLADMNEAPARTTVVLVDGCLRVGKVIPKKHIGFVWENAKGAKTDVTIQGLLGRVTGYSTDVTPEGYDPAGNIHIFISDKLLKEGGNNEIDRYIQMMEDLRKKSDDPAHMISALPQKGMNIKKEKKEVERERRDRDTYYTHTYLLPLSGLNKIPSRVKADVLKYLTETPSDDIIGNLRVSPEQGQEIKETLEDIDASDFVYRNLGAAQFEPLKGRENAEKSWRNKTDWPIVIQDNAPVFILHDEEKVYIFFQTYSKGLETVTVDLSEQVPKTTGREIFCRKYSIMPSGPGPLYSIPQDALYRPSIMEKSLREFIGDWTEYINGRRNVRIEPSIEFNNDWKFDRETYKYKTKKDNLLEKLKEKLEGEFPIKMSILYNRPGEGHFTIRNIQWEGA
jgi:hypothetical protein